MKKCFYQTLVFLIIGLCTFGQKITSRKQFFNKDEIIEATLRTNYQQLIEQKKDPQFIPAILTWQDADTLGTDISEKIQVKLRGNFRKDQCSFASMMFDFSDSTNQSRLKNLKELKVVVPCEWGSDDEQYVIKEYLLYKMYQLFTPYSFRVRMFHFKFDDNSGYMKPYKQYGFMIEPMDDLAKRTNSKEDKKSKIPEAGTNRQHTTLVSIFQYMIGNTDWVIPPRHNIKMVFPKKTGADTKPIVIPYDFDYCGAVNALYAEPPEHIGIKKVTERKYLGYARTIAEVNEVLAIFKSKEDDIMNILEECSLLKPKPKAEMKSFLEEFFTEIKDEVKVQSTFVDKARK
jgi:hypothetical protein